MVLDDFAAEIGDESDDDDSDSSESSSGGSSDKPSRHGTNKLSFDTPYLEVRRYEGGEFQIHIGVSDSVSDGDLKEPRGLEFDSMLTIQSKATFGAFRTRCRNQHGVDPLDIARSDYSFRGFIEDLNDIPDTASDAELLVWLHENTEAPTGPNMKDMCDICGDQGVVSSGNLEEIWLTDKDVVSRDQTRVVTCGDHDISDVIDAANSKRSDEDKPDL